METALALRTLESQGDSITSVAFSPDGKTLASGAGKTVRLWAVKTGQAIHALEGHKGLVTSFDFSPDGKTLISSSWDKTVRLWAVETGQTLDTLRGQVDPLHGVTSIAISPDGKTLALGPGHPPGDDSYTVERAKRRVKSVRLRSLNLQVVPIFLNDGISTRAAEYFRSALRLL
jgi:WD40 repeat protein